MADQRAFGNTDKSPAEVGAQVRDKAQEAGAQVRDKAQEAGAQVRDKAQEAGAQVRDKAQEMVRQGEETASDYYSERPVLGCFLFGQRLHLPRVVLLT